MIFVSYMYIEPAIVMVFDVIPFIYLLSVLFKLKLLSSNNNWHEYIYDKTFAHLQEFDIFQFVWDLASSRIVYLIKKLLKGFSFFFVKLSEDQLDDLEEALTEVLGEIEKAQSIREEKQTKRMSILLNKSLLMDPSSRRGSITAATSDKKKEDYVNSDTLKDRSQKKETKGANPYLKDSSNTKKDK